MSAGTTVLAVFVKQPIPGQVKTRLAASVGDEQAARIYASFQRDIVHNVRDLAGRRVLAYAPDTDDARQHFESLGAGAFETWPQPNVDLGGRMAAFFEEQFASGAERVAIIGSDSPSLPAEFIDQALASLSNRDCVIGPATDGGYYLIGLQQSLASRVKQVFENIEWSSHKVLAQTVTRLQELDASLSLLNPWYDVDTAEDLVAMRGHENAMDYAEIWG